MSNSPIILASASPRRRTFMELLCVSFEVRIASVDERNGQGESPGALVARLSREKALAVAARAPQAIVIGADTVVALGGTILGKPVNPGDAVAMLRRLRDRPHQVYSGVTVCSSNHRVPLTAIAGSTVWMRPYSDEEIAAYVASGDPLDKAGAYGIQNAAFHPVARLRGCYASVMGLPLCRLADMLSQLGIVPPVDVPAVCSAFTGVACCGGNGQDIVFET